MEYDSSITYTENLNLLLEQPGATGLVDDLGRVLGLVSKNIGDDLIKNAKILNTSKAAVTSVDDFVKMAQAGKITPINLGRVQAQLIKSSSVPFAEKTLLLNKVVDQSIKKGGIWRGQNAKAISDDLVKKGYPKQEADYIAKKLNKFNNTKTSTTVPGQKAPVKSAKTKRGKTKNLQPSSQTPPPKPSQSQIDKIKSWIAGNPNFTWGNIRKWGLGVGIGSAVLWAFFYYLGDENPPAEDTPENESEATADNNTVDDNSTVVIGGGGSFTDAPSCEQVKNGESTMSKGVKGDCVGTIQSKLNEVNAAGLKVDNKFGGLTKKAVENFQTKNSIEATGIVDKTTYEKLFGTATAASTGSDYEEAQDTVAGAEEDF